MSGVEQVVNADCLEHMRTMPDNSVDAIVTDPPYGLAFMGKEWDSFGNEGSALQASMRPVFEEALRVAKPGAHLLCFGGTRTFHRMACAIEDAGWECRETIMWVYGQGFPKSMDVAKAIDKHLGAKREVVGKRPDHVISKKWREAEGRSDLPTSMLDITTPATDEAKKWDGWGTCLKPAWEPIIVARKPLDGTVAHNVLTWGVGALNIDACRVPTSETIENHSRSAEAAVSKGKYGDSAAQETHQTDGQKLGRFPANLVHDGSEEVVRLFPQSDGQQGKVDGTEPSRTGDNGIYGHYGPRNEFVPRNDSGSAARFFNSFRDGEESAERTYADKGSTNFAAKPGMRREQASADRFFYCAKASKSDRGEGNVHPCVKPTALMEWLVRLVTPEGGTVLDPFAGSGSTLVACRRLGLGFIGIEREGEYCEIIERRLSEPTQMRMW